MKKRILLILLVGVMLLGLFAVTFVSCGDDETPEGPVTIPGITPDYPAPPLEEGAEDVADSENKLDAPEGGGAVGMIYSNEVEIDLSDKKATLLFANPNRSTHNVSVQLIVQDIVLAGSGLLTPAKRITTLDLKDGVNVPAGVYAQNAKLLVRFYDPETNECSIVNSEIIVTVTVRE
jgi:hypothetical protein